MTENNFWKKCTTCKNQINYGSTYYTCNVSTCNTKRAAMFFCSVTCFDTHIPVMRHKDAYCKESKAPKSLEESIRQEEEANTKKQKQLESKKEAPKNTSSIIVRRKPSI